MEENGINQPMGPDVENELKRFNWGGFFWSWIWALCNGVQNKFVWFALGLWLLCFIPIINTIAPFVLFGFNIYIGVHGNKWAYESREWGSIENFNNTQRAWVKWTFVLWAVMFVLGIIMGILGATLLPVVH